MNSEKIRGSLKMDLQIANTNWTVSHWIKWSLRNKVGLTIEGGKVTGWETRPQRFTT